MFMRNIDIREKMTYRDNGLTRQIPLWVIAERLGIHFNTLRNWLKTELDDERKQLIISAIETIQHELQKGTEVNA